MKVTSPLVVLLVFAAVVLVLALFTGTTAPAQAQSNSGLPWDSVKATLAAWATQMPLNQVATQSAMQRLQIPQPIYATAYTMLTQMPAADVFGTLIAPNFMPPQPTLVPAATEVPPQPTLVPAATEVPPQPTLVPAATEVPPQPTLTPAATEVPPQPTLTPAAIEPTAVVAVDSLPEVTVEPLPEVMAEPLPEVMAEPLPEVTAEPLPEVMAEPLPEGTAEPLPEVTAEPLPEVTVEPNPEAAEQAVVAAGQFSGQVLYPPQTGKESAGIQITLTRPDGSSITLPTGGNGVFAFSNMTAGPYTLVAQATGYLTTQTSFVLNAGEERQLPTAVLVVGDTNGDNRVDLSDAALVASNFNGPAIVTEVDLNEDGWIDVRDLTLIGAAFGLSGPTPWEDS